MKARLETLWWGFWAFFFGFQLGAEGWREGRTDEEVRDEALRRICYRLLARTPQEKVQPDNERVVMALVLLHGMGYRVYPLKGRWRAIAVEDGFDVVSV